MECFAYLSGSTIHLSNCSHKLPETCGTACVNGELKGRGREAGWGTDHGGKEGLTLGKPGQLGVQCCEKWR